jgi:hypothetical protein
MLWCLRCGLQGYGIAWEGSPSSNSLSQEGSSLNDRVLGEACSQEASPKVGIC